MGQQPIFFAATGSETAASVGSRFPGLNAKRGLGAVLDSISDGLCFIDRRWRIIYTNRAARRVFAALGVDGKLSGLFKGKLSHVKEAMPELEQALLEQRPAHAELKCIALGTWFEIHAYPWRRGLIVQFRDTTTRWRQGEALEQSEMQFKNLVENVPDIVIRFDRYGGIKYVNPAFFAILGIAATEAVGRSLQELSAAFPGLKYLQQPFSAVLATGAPQSIEFNFSGPQGTVFIETRLIPEFNPAGKVATVLCIGRNITERRKLEYEIARLDRLSVVGEMAASLAHEVRNPMTTVRGFLQYFREKQQIYAGQDEHYDLMIDELDRANAIISEYLSLARDRTVDMTAGNLETVVQAILPLLQADALRLGSVVRTNLQGTLPVLMNQKEIRQCIINLVRNGLEAVPSGGVVKISTYLEGDRAVLQVADNGPGIPPAVMEKLGTPFFTTKENGSGLGLAVCYSIAARHGAKLEVRTGSSGSTFLIRFPLLNGMVSDDGKDGRRLGKIATAESSEGRRLNRMAK